MILHGHPGSALPGPGAWVLAFLLAMAALGYPYGVSRLRRRAIGWPVHRTAAWLAGCLAIGTALLGPLAARAHHDFVAHMATHVLLGMLTPLLLVLAAPATLALRALPVGVARRLGRVLASGPVGLLANPLLAAVLSVGGLWVLYRTGLFAATQHDPVVHTVVHAHVLAAGYLFTFAVLAGPDPAPHRLGPRWRAAILVVAIAAHNVLSKLVYADPPAGVAVDQAQAGAQLMYYAGAPVEVALLALVCGPWLLSPPRVRRRPAARAH